MGRLSFTERRRRKLSLKIAQLEICEPKNMITESLGLFLFTGSLRTVMDLLGPPVTTGAKAPLSKSDLTPTSGVGQSRNRRLATTDHSNISAFPAQGDVKSAAGGQSSGDVSGAGSGVASSRSSGGDWLNLTPLGGGASSDEEAGGPFFKPHTPVQSAGGGAASSSRGGGPGGPQIAGTGARPSAGGGSGNGFASTGSALMGVAAPSRSGSVAGSTVQLAPASKADPTAMQAEPAAGNLRPVPEGLFDDPSGRVYPQDASHPTVAIYPTDSSASEAGPDTATFAVVDDGPYSIPETFSFSPYVSFEPSGTAVPGRDYSLSPPSTVTIPAFSNTATVTLTPIRNNLQTGTLTAWLWIVPSDSYGIAAKEDDVNGPVSIADADGSIPQPTPPTDPASTPGTFSVLNKDTGGVLFPGSGNIATLGASADLQVQADGFGVSSVSWTTTGLTHANTIAGAATSELTFNWNGSNTTTAVDTLSVAVTKTDTTTSTQTFNFFVPTTAAYDFGTPTYPTTLPPDLVKPGGATFGAPDDPASVDVNSGDLFTSVSLPAYNANVPALSFAFGMLSSVPSSPIVLAHDALGASLAVPDWVSGQISINGHAGSVVYYDTSQTIPGDVLQMALQTNSTFSTGRYGYTVTLVEDRSGALNTITYTGNTDVINDSAGAFGSGWTLQGLNRIIPATGGVILELNQGRSLWFSGSSSFTSPAGDFSTLVKNGDGSYTRTLADGTEERYSSAGYEIANTDLNNRTITYAYDTGHKLTTIIDPYGKATTLTYDVGNKLQAVKDPSGRITTFTHSGGNLTAVQQADGKLTTFTYSGGNRMIAITDPLNHATTFGYDASVRIGTITRANGTTEEFSAFQEQGRPAPGTGTSPSNKAPVTILAQARASYTDPDGKETYDRVDRYGLGQVTAATDDSGHVAAANVDSDGLPVQSIDKYGALDQTFYDSQGNPTTMVNGAGAPATNTYDSVGDVVTEVDARGNVTSYVYDADYNNTQIIDPLGGVTTMTYTPDGMLQSTSDARGNTTSYAYDANDNVTTTTYPDGTTTLDSYDSQGNLTSETDQRGGVTTYAYDALGRETGTTDALHNHTTYSYDGNGNMIAATDPLGRTTSCAYDSQNRLTTVTDPLGHTTVYGYDWAGNLDTVTDGIGRVTTYAYDSLNRPTAVTDPLGRITTTVYDPDDNVTGKIDANGDRTTYVYDPYEQQVAVIDPLGHATTTAYDVAGNSISVTDQLGHTTTTMYDSLNRVQSVTDSLLHVTTYGYDAVGNQITVTDPLGNTTTTMYDALNRATTVTDPLGHATVTGHDADGNQVTATDGLGNVTTTAYDALNRATTVTDPIGDVTVTGFDAVGNQLTEKDPDGNVTTFAYDPANRLTTVSYPGGGTHTYVYDNANEKTDSTDADGRRTTYAYDKDGRQTGETWLTASGGALRLTTWTYDNAGRMTGVADPDATLTYSYDSGGRMTSAVTHGTAGQPTVTLAYGYDNANNQTSVTDGLSSVGRTTYTYDAANRLTTITRTLGGSGGPQVAFGYDNAGRTTSESRTIGGSGTAVSTSMAYDAASRLTTLTHQVAGGAALASYVYGYDNADRVSAETDDGGAAVSYAYDSSDQLTTVTGGRSETYTYDAAGNRSMTGYATTTFDQLTSGAGCTYVYDGEGNLTSERNSSTGAVTSFAWDYHDRLTGITEKNSGGTILHQVTYTYDALGDRIGVDEDGTQTWTAYDGQNSYADFSGGGTLQQRYLYGPAVDEVLARTDGSGVTAWYLTDRQGSVRNVSDASGALTATVTYDGYGQVLSQTGTGADRFLYTAREYDATFGLQYNRARYYDAAIGRWISEDPTEFAAGDTNLYRYVTNNPINATDPTGLYAGVDLACYDGTPIRTDSSTGKKIADLGPLFREAAMRTGAVPVDCRSWGKAVAAITKYGKMGKINDLYIIDHGYRDSSGQEMGNVLITPGNFKPIRQYLRPGHTIYLLGCFVGSNTNYCQNIADVTGDIVCANQHQVMYGANPWTTWGRTYYGTEQWWYYYPRGYRYLEPTIPAF